MQIDDVVVDRTRFKDVESAFVTSKQIWNKNLLMLDLSSKAIEQFKKK